ncbi:hypothetical protein LTR97_009474 [Elasticomyces elasticus]|uniref:histone acetyltransferase n=1 Tax=Elasticomyces elasticus TaxID=574655 RepID=A0AAN7VNF9_9PEZI|nr:hypothetical protein LTR97_009474 [Elasticomyces elasticus]
MDSKTASLAEALATALSADSTTDAGGKLRYLHTPPKPCDPLFSPPPGHEPEKTRLSSHFLTFSINACDAVGHDPLGSSALGSQEEGVLGIAIELLVYTTRYLTTLFVSKADTTGYIPNHPPSRTKAVCSAFIKWLVEQEQQRHPHRKVVVSLFARAQSQYLFPGSAEHKNKHVLDDRQLIRWWARVLDPLLDIAIDQEVKAEINGYVTIPGYDNQELRSYLPRTQHSHGRQWKTGHPLAELAETRGVSAAAPPRSLLPRFPDDPKARFMQDLDDEVGLAGDAPVTVSPPKRKSGRWNNVGDLARFWEAMEFRQECSSGRVVGFLWIVVSPGCDSKDGSQLTDAIKDEIASLEQGSTRTLADAPDIVISAPASQLHHSLSDPRDTTPTPSQSISASPTKKRKRKPLTGPIIPRQPRLKGGSSSLTATSSDLNGMLNSIRGDGLLITQEGYDRAMQTLLHLDFANLAIATRSTTKWVNEVASVCGLASDWGVKVVGRALVAIQEPKASAASNGGGSGGAINDLGGMVRKKKRKDIDDTPAVNVLSARKKPKAVEA